MPLDRSNGEMITSLGPHFHVVSTTKWVDTPIWWEAHNAALEVFKRTVKEQRMKMQMPLIEPVAFPPESVVCQEYPTKGCIVFWFQARLGGKDFYRDIRITLPPEAIEHLSLIGRWKRETIQ